MEKNLPETRPLTARIPDKPGVYLMKDAGGEIIYIGKASSLKKRVSSYFNKPGADIKTRVLVKNIADIDFIVTDSEVEALMLESTLIKKHTPRFNIRLKDDKRYPYIAITMGEEYPRAVFTRRLDRDGDRYFGPYTDAGAARQVLSMINRTFKLKTCKKEIPLKPGERPCLNYQMNRCSGVCTGRTSREEYLAIVDSAVKFLEGGTEPVIADLRAMMERYAAAMEYEKAARIRDILTDISTMSQEQKVYAPVGMDTDLMDIATGRDEALLLLFEYRQGSLTAKKIFLFDRVEYSTPGEILRGFLVDHYGRNEVPSRVVVPRDIDDRGAVESFMRTRSPRKISLTIPRGPEDKAIMRLIRKNLDIATAERAALKVSRDMGKGMDELRAALRLDRPPEIMECFDISNTGGKQAVASMVRFRGGSPEKKSYRRYRIKTFDQPNDPGMIHEAVGRRIQHLINEGLELPDLIVVDGGRGQLSRALEIKEAFGIDTRFVSLAKRFEEIYTNPAAEPLRLPASSPALKILQRLRDEAHRFAVTYHRLLRDRKSGASIIDGIPGIGAKKKNLLLKHLNEPMKVKTMALPELEAIPGLGQKTARSVYDHFHSALDGPVPGDS